MWKKILKKHWRIIWIFLLQAAMQVTFLLIFFLLCYKEMFILFPKQLLCTSCISLFSSIPACAIFC